MIDWDRASPGPRAWDLAHLAYRLVPLSSVDHSDGFTARERQARLDLLIDAYGTRLAPKQLRQVVSDRHCALAEFSDEKAIELSKPELAEHAKLYRADALEL